MEQNCKESIEEIIELLNSKKKLQVIEYDNKINLQGFQFLFHAQDESQQDFSLIVNHNNNQKDLHIVKTQAKYLKGMNHPHIIQIIDEFTIGQFYFIQTERIYTSLLDWINDSTNKRDFTEQHYVEIALQLMNVTEYINKNKYAIPLESTLSCFFIDKEKKIKLLCVCIPKTISKSKIQSHFRECKEKNELFFYRKDTLSLNSQCKVTQNYHFDVWAIGICLYYLSGISAESINSYLENQGPYLFSESLGFQNNAILFTILFEYGKDKYKPSFYEIIGYLLNEQKQLQKERHLSNGDYEFKQIQKDLEKYVRIHKLIDPKDIKLFDIEDMSELMERYGVSEILLNQQAKLYFLSQKVEQALSNIHKMIEINPRSDIALFTLGYLFAKMKQHEQSISYYQKAIALNQINHGAYQNIGCYYYDQKDYRNAIKYNILSFKLNPNVQDLVCQFGYANWRLFEYKKSIQYFRFYFEFTNEDSLISNKLAEIYESEAQFEKAIRFQRLTTDPYYLSNEKIKIYKSNI